MTIAAFTNEDFLAACRADFLTFGEAAWDIVNPGKQLVAGLHWRLIADHLERTAMGDIKRLGICMPPRYGKSYLVSIAFPAWLLGQDPSKQIVCVSYAKDLAEQHAADCKTLMTSGFYKDVFPATRIDVHNQYRPKRYLIEDTLNAPAVVANLADHQVRNVELIRPAGDKKSRLYSQAGWFHRQQVLFPSQAPWLPALREEWQPFPHGVHDDQIDAISQALGGDRGRRGRMYCP